MKKILGIFIFSFLFSGSVYAGGGPFTILYPTGGENLVSGQTYSFKWSGWDFDSSFNPISGYSIYLYGRSLGVNGPKYLGSINTSSSQFNWTVPTDIPAGSYTVNFQGPSQTGAISGVFSIGNTTTPQPPTISSMSPTSALPGSLVYIYGTNFNQGIFVALDGAYGQTITPTLISDTSISFVVPSNISMGTHTVQVSEKASNFPLSNAVNLNVVSSQNPTISSMSPTSAFVGGSVHIYGTNFTNKTYISVNNGSQTITPNSISPTAITFSVPSNLSVGSHTIQVGETGSGLPLSNPVYLTVVSASQNPTISSISPTSVLLGNEVYIYGTNFTNNTVVAFDSNGQRITPNFISPTTLKFTVPSNLSVGSHTVSVGVLSSVLPFSNIVNLNVVSPQPPTISSMSPTSALPGSLVYIYGTNFNQGIFVALDGAYGQTITPTLISDTSISFVVPSNISMGTHTVQVSEKASNFPLSNAVNLNVVSSQNPTISSMSPTSAFVGGSVHIYGTNFTNKTYISVNNGSQTITPNSISPTAITFSVPSNLSVGSHTIQVGETGSGLPLSNPVYLTVVSASQNPTISSISPTSNILQGSTVYVSGTNFSDKTYVYIDNGRYVIKPTFDVVSKTSLKFILPPNISFGSHTVQVVEGSGPLSNFFTINIVETLSSNFSGINDNFLKAPTISSISPMYALQGGQVTVSGTNFNYNTYVSIDGNSIKSNTSFISPTSITFTVPSNISIGSHSIQVGEGSAISSAVYLTVLSSANILTVQTPSTTPTVNQHDPVVGDVDTQDQSAGSCLNLQNNLRYRSKDITTNQEVSALQDFLQFKGYLNSEPTGYFGILTFQAVKRFQSDNGISPTGFVGSITRGKISYITCGNK